jgi:hypothetical protein
MSVEINQDLEALKEYAEDIGVEFSPAIGYDTLKSRVDAQEEEIALKQKEKKAKKESVANEPKVKIIVNPRDSSDNITDQFFGLNGKNILIKFDEEIEVTESMYEHIKSIGGYIHAKRTVTGEDGMPKNEWYNKYQSRFLVSKV